MAGGAAAPAPSPLAGAPREHRHRCGDLDLLHDDDARADLARHHLERLEALLELRAGEADERARVRDAELVVRLSAALEQAPLHLRDETRKARWRRVEELQLVLDVPVVRLGDEPRNELELDGERAGRRARATARGSR